MTSPRPALWLVAAFVGCGATCSRSDVRSEERHEVVTLDAGVRVEESAVLRVDREERSEHGAVDTVRVVEEFDPVPAEVSGVGGGPAGVPQDGGGPTGSVAPTVPIPGRLIRRTTTTTHVAPSTRTVNTEAHAEAHSEAEAAVSETLATDVAQRSDVQRTTDVGLSWPVKVALLVAVLLVLALAWRFREAWL